MYNQFYNQSAQNYYQYYNSYPNSFTGISDNSNFSYSFPSNHIQHMQQYQPYVTPNTYLCQYSTTPSYNSYAYQQYQNTLTQQHDSGYSSEFQISPTVSSNPREFPLTSTPITIEPQQDGPKRQHVDSRKRKCKYELIAEQLETEKSTAKSTKRLKTVTIDLKTNECNECKFVSRTKADLIIHQWVYHKHQDSKTCPICNKVYSTTNNALIHLHHHTQERLHKCTSCTKSFYDVSSLHKHMNTHLKTKPFVCNVCGKDFAQKCNLKKHQFSKHKFSN